MNQNSFMSLPGISPEEMGFLNQGMSELTESQQQSFFMIYSSKRKNPQDMLIFSIVGLCLIPGLQRFMTGQIGMGILYLFTAGLCIVGSIVDLVNYKTITLDYNQKMAFESFQMSRMGA